MGTEHSGLREDNSKISSLYSFGLDLSGFRIASFHIMEKVLRICVSREGSQNVLSYLGNMVEVTVIGSKPAA